jgi:hypothetical protein
VDRQPGRLQGRVRTHSQHQYCRPTGHARRQGAVHARRRMPGRHPAQRPGRAHRGPAARAPRARRGAGHARDGQPRPRPSSPNA